MNKKAEIGVGMIIVVAVALIIGVVFMQAIAQQVGSSTNTIAVANTSLSTKVVNGTSQYLTNYRALSSVEIYNETNGTAGVIGDKLAAANYTITNNVVYNGALAVQVYPKASEAFKSKWLISGTAQPLTYISDSGGRAIASLIVIMFALAVLVVALVPNLRNGLMDMVGK